MAKVYELINHAAYLSDYLLGDLNSVWDVRIAQTLINQVKEMSSSDFELVLFYLTMISRGVFFLHKHIGEATRHLNYGIGNVHFFSKANV